MTKRDEKLEQKSPANPEIGALDNTDLEKVTGGFQVRKAGGDSLVYVKSLLSPLKVPPSSK